MPPSLAISPRRLIGALALGVASGLLISLAAGVSLGLYLAPLVFLVLIVPPLVSSGTTVERLCTGSAVAVGLIVIPFGASLMSARVSVPGALVWSGLMLTFGAAMVGLVALLHRLKMAWVFASALTTVVSLAWLTWPVWLAPHVQDEVTVGRLVFAHPLFAINTLFPQLGIWTEQATAYRLTHLNQDVPYALPDSAWPCLLLHAALASGCIALSRLHFPRTSGAKTVSAN